MLHKFQLFSLRTLRYLSRDLHLSLYIKAIATPPHQYLAQYICCVSFPVAT
jgi:hypothetical protein